MKLKDKDRFLFTLAAILMVATLATGCHKGNKEESYEYMEGSLVYNIPEYALVGRSFTVKAGGITSPVEGVTYSWYSTMRKDTIRGVSGVEATFTVPDSIAKFTITQAAQAPGYYQTTATRYCTSIIPYIGHSLTGVTVPTDSIQDSRDGQFYYVIKAGKLMWFAENLNYQGLGGAYALSDDVGVVLGRYYTWEDAQKACPTGWRVPTNEDWEDLAEALGGKKYAFKDNWAGLGEMVMADASFNGDKFWPYSAKVKPQAKFGWDALAAGCSTDNYKHNQGLFSYAYFWSATEKDSENAYFRYLYYNLPNFSYGYTPKNGMGASVRCVKDL